MGGQSYSSNVYSSISSTNAKKTAKQIFTSSRMPIEMDPSKKAFREARDSDVNPETIPIIVGLDVTGSMGDIPEALCKGKLGTLIETVNAHNVKYPAILFAGVGDHYSDNAPLQIGQFESGAEELNKWLTTVWLEGGGGGQAMESYPLVWGFAGKYTSTDSFERRGQKGFLFTIGDEGFHPEYSSNFLKDLFNMPEASNTQAKEMLDEALKMWEIFHIHVEDGSYPTKRFPGIAKNWKDLLGERFIVLEDSEYVAETIASTVSVILGANLSDVVKGFDSKTTAAVTNALVAVSSNIPTLDSGVLKL